MARLDRSISAATAATRCRAVAMACLACATASPCSGALSVWSTVRVASANGGLDRGPGRFGSLRLLELRAHGAQLANQGVDFGPFGRHRRFLVRGDVTPEDRSIQRTGRGRLASDVMGAGTQQEARRSLLEGVGDP